MNLLIAAGAALAYVGLAANGITLDRHYADLHGRGKEPDRATRLRFRLLGWLGLALSFAACIGAAGWHLGPVLWCGVLTGAAIVLTLFLNYAPRKAVAIGYLACPAALLVGAAGLVFG